MFEWYVICNLHMSYGSLYYDLIIDPRGRPQSRPVVITIFTQSPIFTSVPKLQNQATITAGRDCGLAEWIIVYFVFSRFWIFSWLFSWAVLAHPICLRPAALTTTRTNWARLSAASAASGIGSRTWSSGPSSTSGTNSSAAVGVNFLPGEVRLPENLFYIFYWYFIFYISLVSFAVSFVVSR